MVSSEKNVHLETTFLQYKDYADIFGVRCTGCQIRVWCSKKAIFTAVGRQILGFFDDKANVITQ